MTSPCRRNNTYPSLFFSFQLPLWLATAKHRIFSYSRIAVFEVRLAVLLYSSLIVGGNWGQWSLTQDARHYVLRCSCPARAKTSAKLWPFRQVGETVLCTSRLMLRNKLCGLYSYKGVTHNTTYCCILRSMMVPCRRHAYLFRPRLHDYHVQHQVPARNLLWCD